MKDRMLKKFNKGDYQVEWTEEPNIPGSLNIELTSACNHNCIFCCYHSPYTKLKRQPSTMTLEDAKKILDMAKEEGFGTFEVGFHMSGESVLHKNFAECVRYAKSLGFTYVFTTTNGACIDNNKLKDIIDAGLDSIRFSFNGYDRDSYLLYHGHDDFDKVLDNIRYLNKYVKENDIKISTSVSTVLTKESVNHKNEFIDLLSGLVDEHVFIPVLSLDKVSKEVDEEFGFPKKVEFEYTPCVAPFNSLYITSEKNVVVCCDGSRYADMVVGNIDDYHCLSDIWYSERFKEIRRSFIGGKAPFDDCKGCALINKNKEMLV